MVAVRVEACRRGERSSDHVTPALGTDPDHSGSKNPVAHRANVSNSTQIMHGSQTLQRAELAT